MLGLPYRVRKNGPKRQTLVLAQVVLAAMVGLEGCSELAQDPSDPADHAPVVRPFFKYPCQVERLHFPKDEGQHSVFEWPVTVVEWYAVYSHLTADDGSRYFLFTTFVTSDPVEMLVQGRFPHIISTLIDITDNRTYNHSSNDKLKHFVAGHVDTESAKGDYLRWKGQGRPFEYTFHVAWRDARVNYDVNLELSAMKLPLAVGGGYVQQPQGISGYYSQTRIATKGEIVFNGAKKNVSGISWIDRQWLGAMAGSKPNGPADPTDPVRLGSIAQGEGRHGYDWWAIQLDNHEEAILYRIFEAKDKKIVSTLLEICHADGTREHVDDFTLTDLPDGWRLVAAKPGWNLTITPVCSGHRPGTPVPTGVRGATWHSCRVVGTIRGKQAAGLAVAELVPDVPRGSSARLRIPAVSAPDATP